MLIDGRAQRWLFGVASEEDTFLPTPEMPQTLLLPENRKFVYPWVGWQLIEDDYREMSELNDMGRTEDISLGLNLYFSLGFAEERFGSDRDATLFRSTVQRGWEPGGPGRVLLFTAGGSTRARKTACVNSIAYAGARYYRRNLEKHLFSVSLSALASDKLDADTQVLLGGDNGLRGYPLRYQAGTQRAILTVEERFYTDFYPWRLFRVGYAAFMDVGRVDGQDPRASPSLGTLYDVGVRLASELAALERPLDRAHRSRVPAERRPVDRQGAAARRDQRLVLGRAASRLASTRTERRRCRARAATS